MVTALKIPKKYFAGTGIGTGFHRVRDGRDRDEKTRSRRTLISAHGLHDVMVYNFSFSFDSVNVSKYNIFSKAHTNDCFRELYENEWNSEVTLADDEVFIDMYLSTKKIFDYR